MGHVILRSIVKMVVCITLFVVIVFCLSSVYSAFVSDRAPHVYYVRSLPGTMMAQTIPPFGIFIEEAYKDEGDGPGTILAHERIHWLQYQEMGFWSFYMEYISGWLKDGRLYNELEEDARQRSK